MTSRSLRIAFATISILLVAALAGCSAPTATETPTPEAPAESPAAGSKMAPGVYGQPDGTASILGTLEYEDLEGGVWKITDGTLASGDPGKALAVISNAAQMTSDLEKLKGTQVLAVGKAVEGASVRMAGPEYTISSIEAVSDTGGAAE